MIVEEEKERNNIFGHSRRNVSSGKSRSRKRSPWSKSRFGHEKDGRKEGRKEGRRKESGCQE
jgi:hypothetical protein